MNYDGLFDLLVGDGLTAASAIRYYENIGSIGDPEFATAEKLKLKNGTTINPDYDVHFCVGDWNGDGGNDIIYSGYYDGSKNPLYFLEGDPHNVDINTIPKFNSKNISLIIKQKTITISSKNHLNKISIFNLRGEKLISRSNLNTSMMSLDISSFSKGAYLIKVSTSNETLNKRIVLR